MHVLNRVDVVLLGLMMISILCVLVKIEYQQAPLLSVRALIISSAVGVVVLWRVSCGPESRPRPGRLSCLWTLARIGCAALCYVTCDV